MNTDKYISRVCKSKGQFIKLKWTRTVETAAAYRGLTILKETTATARTGIDYENLRMVQEARQNGSKPAKNAGLTWGEWKENCFPWIIEHRGQDYARIYSAPGAVPDVQFYLNGVKVNRSQILSYLTPSDRKKEIELDGSCNECFTVKMADIEEVG